MEMTFEMGMTWFIVLSALAVYATDRWPIEIVSIGIVIVLMVVFHIYPIQDATGDNLLGAGRLLHGFASPAVIAIMALLIIGRGLMVTGALDALSRCVLQVGKETPTLSILLCLICVMVASAFLNNIPVVMIFIPVMQSIAQQYNISVSKVMMPLSFSAVFGGMTTLVGSGTNILVSITMVEFGEQPFHFFDFTVPGLVMAMVGFFYITVAMPFILPERLGMSSTLLDESPKNDKFIAQVDLSTNPSFIGKKIFGNHLPDMPDVRLVMILRKDKRLSAPFDGLELAPDDTVIVSASREVLERAMFKNFILLHSHSNVTGVRTSLFPQDRLLAEAVIQPSSSLVGKTLREANFEHEFSCIVLAVQRRNSLLQEEISDIKLQAGDLLLVEGVYEAIRRLREAEETIVKDKSRRPIPKVWMLRKAVLIFVCAIGLAAFGFLPLVTSAMLGALCMVLTGVLTVKQAVRAIDSKIITSMAAALAMGFAVQETGGAHWLASIARYYLSDSSPTVYLSVLFLIVALITNIVSTQTCAVLFTPIAIAMANSLGISPIPFAVAVMFASNCAFATPVGYQTSLMVFGVGHYRFSDFFVSGIPLLFCIWLSFTFFAPMWYGL